MKPKFGLPRWSYFEALPSGRNFIIKIKFGKVVGFRDVTDKPSELNQLNLRMYHLRDSERMCDLLTWQLNHKQLIEIPISRRKAEWE
jgi:Leucine-rich repeat (LRR) protein